MTNLEGPIGVENIDNAEDKLTVDSEKIQSILREQGIDDKNNTVFQAIKEEISKIYLGSSIDTDGYFNPITKNGYDIGIFDDGSEEAEMMNKLAHKLNNKIESTIKSMKPNIKLDFEMMSKLFSNLSNNKELQSILDPEAYEIRMEKEKELRLSANYDNASPKVQQSKGEEMMDIFTKNAKDRARIFDGTFDTIRKAALSLGDK